MPAEVGLYRTQTLYDINHTLYQLSRGRRWLRPEGGWPAKLRSTKPLALWDAWGRPDNDAYYRSPEYCASATVAAFGTLGTALNVFKGAASLPEIMAPARRVLDALGDSAGFPKVSTCFWLGCTAGRNVLFRTYANGPFPGLA